MFRRVHSLLLALFLLAGGFLQAQEAVTFDTCIDFANYGYLNSVPPGWKVRTSNNAASVGVYVSSSDMIVSSIPPTCTSVTVVTSDLGRDLPSGGLVRFWTRGLEGDTITMGMMTDTSNFSSFVEIASFEYDGNYNWVQVLAEIPDATGYKCLAFRWKRNIDLGARYGSFALRAIRIMSDGCWASNLRVMRTEADSVKFLWDYIGSPDVTLDLLDLTDGISTEYANLQEGRVTVPVVAGHEYSASFSAICDNLWNDCSQNYNSYNIQVPMFDPSECVNIGMLYSNKVTPYYGTYNNPYSHRGEVLDYGQYNVNSRHTVNTDTSMRDPIVGPALRVIPEGDEMSVRLGNWNVGGQAEAMLYTIPVDTNRADMLILKYAAVMEDPSHTPDIQPRFRIEMLDDSMNLIAPVSCNSYDFIASPALGWNTTPDGVLWKDWTIVGIDLSAYHGRNVRLRLTTYDCGYSAHYGYAYYTLSCARKSFSFLSCTIGDSNRVAAPAGFNYSWHRDDNPAIIGTEPEITIPVDNHTYFCDLGFIGNPSCSVSMSVVSKNIFPVARMGYSVERDSCRFKINFRNLSHFVDDTLHRGQYTEWIFHDGTHSPLENPVVYTVDTGLYYVALVSGFSADDCTDTVYDTLHLVLAFDTTDAVICETQHYLFCDSLFATAGSYTMRPNCDSISMLNLVVNDTTLIDTFAVACLGLLYRDSLFLEDCQYDFVYPDARGCDSTYRLHLQVHPTYELSDTLRFCKGYPYLYCGVDYGGPTSFDTTLFSIFDCDSLVHVTLEPLDTALHVRAYYSFDQTQWTDTLPILLCSPSTLYLRDSSALAVSWQWTLSNGETSSSPTPQFFIQDASISQQTLQLEVESAGGCRDTLLWPVIVFPSPEADFAWDPAIPVDIAPTAQFFGLSELDDCYDYHWFFQRETGSSTVDTLEGKEVVYTWEGSLPTGDFDVRMVAYSLRYYDTISHTCTDTALHTVTIVTAFLQFPNLVTPNGDGVNDIWRVVNLLELGLYSMNELWIYNSWGALVYHAEDIRREDQFWDPNATNSPDGTYYFRFSAKGFHGLVRVNGSIEVVR